MVRQGKHIAMTDGTHILTIPRANPINAFTMAGIVRDADLTEEEFKKLLSRQPKARRREKRVREEAQD